MERQDTGQDTVGPVQGGETGSAEIDVLERQELIRHYESTYDCQLIVVLADLLTSSVSALEHLLIEMGTIKRLHLLLNTLGGDGEVAVRIVRQIRARCDKLTVVVPVQAKSAGTLLVLGADEVVMGPTSDLGPIDPQVWLEDYGYKPAKTIVAAFEYAETAARDARSIATFHSSALENRSAYDAQEARESLSHSHRLLQQALGNNPRRNEEDISVLTERLAPLLVTEPKVHEASISAEDMSQAGLPVTALNPLSDQWQDIWNLWSHYLRVSDTQIYESNSLTYLFDLEPGD